MGQQHGRAQEQLRIGVALLAENMYVITLTSGGGGNISFWSAQSFQAEYGFPLMHADFLIYDDYSSVVFLTSHDV